MVKFDNLEDAWVYLENHKLFQLNSLPIWGFYFQIDMVMVDPKTNWPNEDIKFNKKMMLGVMHQKSSDNKSLDEEPIGYLANSFEEAIIIMANDLYNQEINTQAKITSNVISLNHERLKRLRRKK